MIASPLRPRQRQEPGIAAAGRLAHQGTPYGASLSFATTTHLWPLPDPPSRKPPQRQNWPHWEPPGQFRATPLPLSVSGSPCQGPGTGLPPPISTSVPGTPAALYELTPLKNVCLAKCRSPLGFLVGTWRDGRLGALRMGSRLGGWCLGCCWSLMAALFALGVMSLTWMAFVAALITLEKTLPWRRAVTWGTAAILLALAISIVAAPDAVPGLVVPGGSQSAMQTMNAVR